MMIAARPSTIGATLLAPLLCAAPAAAQGCPRRGGYGR